MANPYDHVYKTIYRLKAGRVRVRSFYETPLRQRVVAMWRQSAPGKLSMTISDKSHALNMRFWLGVEYRLSLYKVRRRIALFFATFVSCFMGYVMSGFGTNLYTLGYCQG